MLSALMAVDGWPTKERMEIFPEKLSSKHSGAKVMNKQMLRACVTITIFIDLLVSSVSVAKAQQAPKQTKPLRDGYVPDLAKPDRENKDVQANAIWRTARRFGIRCCPIPTCSMSGISTSGRSCGPMTSS
jgi:hypothetical protein